MNKLTRIVLWILCIFAFMLLITGVFGAFNGRITTKVAVLGTIE